MTETPHRIACPECATILVVFEPFPRAVLYCPRCDWRIPYLVSGEGCVPTPAERLIYLKVGVEYHVFLTPRESPQGDLADALAVTCPHCESALLLYSGTESRCVVCPKCWKHLPNPDAEEDSPCSYRMAVSVEDLERQGRRATSGCYVLVTIMGAVTTACLWAVFSLGAFQGSNIPEELLACLGIFFFAILGLGWMMKARTEIPSAQAAGQIILAIFALFGAMAATLLLMLVVVVIFGLIVFAVSR